MDIESYLESRIEEALRRLGIYPEVKDFRIELEKPRDPSYGDMATTVALNLARHLKKPPRQIAEELVSRLELDSDIIAKVQIDGPGFINFFLSGPFLYKSLEEILGRGVSYGESELGRGQKIQVEFVSANPTGPLNVVSARAATVGDVMVNVLRAVGFDARREYYVNDAGRQVKLLGQSVSSRYCHLLGVEEPFPEEGYRGEYVWDLAKEILSEFGEDFLRMNPEERVERLQQIALEKILAQQKSTLEAFGVHYDVWFRESELRRSGAEQEVLELFRSKNLVYEREGALWFRSSQFGDEKDRVLITREGEPTYFFVDIAYHLNKYRRGFEVVYDLWGPDHHGYIDRMKAAILALGYPEQAFRVYIIQQVNLYRDGRPVKMSKRAGRLIEMKELIEEVGVDAARFFFLLRRISSPLDFDLDLAKKQTEENPVYYIQYAHARICNILRFAEEKGIPLPTEANWSLLKEKQELELIKKMMEYPRLLVRVAKSFEPHPLTQYLMELATIFHKFYHDYRVVMEEEPLMKARLRLVEATRIVFSNVLRILGVSAPEKM